MDTYHVLSACLPSRLPDCRVVSFRKEGWLIKATQLGNVLYNMLVDVNYSFYIEYDYSQLKSDRKYSHIYEAHE